MLWIFNYAYLDIDFYTRQSNLKVAVILIYDALNFETNKNIHVSWMRTIYCRMGQWLISSTACIFLRDKLHYVSTPRNNVT